MPKTVTLCECFARDGLQNETAFVETADKIDVINGFAAAGFARIEATSYSHPKHVPAFRDASEVLAGLRRSANVRYKATCPNLRAVDRAIADLDAGKGAEEISFLTSASEAHSRKNLKKTRADQWREVTAMADRAGGRFVVVGVVSVALGCPFEGAVDPGVVVEDAARLADLGGRLLTVGDTTGMATPPQVRSLFERLAREVPQIEPVAHFHNARGSAIANCVAALEAGCTHFDSAMGGVGGHPARIQYGGGMTGNVPTEDLVNLFEAMGVDTGLDLDRVMTLSRRCEKLLGRDLYSMVARAGWCFSKTGVDTHV